MKVMGVDTRAEKEVVVAINTEQYYFLHVGILSAHSLYMREGHSPSLFIQGLVFFLII